MQGLTIQLDREDNRYIPGEPITGRVAWDLSDTPKRVAVRLLWHTSGKGSRDIGIVGEETWQPTASRGEHDFSFPGVDGPYSFSGNLITVGWSIEADARGARDVAEHAITLSPTGEEVRT